MDWLKLSADFWTHPKITGLSDRAFRVLVASWAYAARHETGGHVPATVYPLLRAGPRQVAELQGAGVWHPNGDGALIHDWDDHQQAALELREDREHKRALARDRQAAKRARERGVTA